MKSEIRKRILEHRDKLSINEISLYSKIIAEKVLSLPAYQKAQCIMFYVSFKSEVSTMDMILRALTEGKRVCVPLVKENGIIPSEIRAVNEINKKNKFGILEPSEIREIPKKEIHLVIVPCGAFDRFHHRLGYGYRYYDDFLRGYAGRKIGLAFSLQEVDGIPPESWDVKLDAVVTEKWVV